MRSTTAVTVIAVITVVIPINKTRQERRHALVVARLPNRLLQLLCRPAVIWRWLVEKHLLHRIPRRMCEILQQMRENSSPDAFLLPRRGLLEALDHAVRLTRHRVRAGETNTKAAAFFACVRAHFGARRASDPRHAITDAAGTILKECMAVLERRLFNLANDPSTTSRTSMDFPTATVELPDAPADRSSPAAYGADRRVSGSSLSYDDCDPWGALSDDDNAGFTC